jgi:enamine deaminase RidA (YjgF/YER057c/UK114 family)
MTPDRQVVEAPEAPAAIGPYSHAVHAGGLLFCSGQPPACTAVQVAALPRGAQVEIDAVVAR